MNIRRTPKPDGRVPFSQVPFKCVFSDGVCFYVRTAEVVCAAQIPNRSSTIYNALRLNDQQYVRFELEAYVILKPNAELWVD